MVKEIMHVGLTVSNLEQSIHFYKEILGMSFEGELIMEGESTDILFGRKNCRVRVAYLNGGSGLSAPPVELIQFTDSDAETAAGDLHRTSISELCFRTEDIDIVYENLLKQGVECISPPQYFDFTEYGFGKSRALYFKDPDGIILELMQPVAE